MSKAAYHLCLLCLSFLFLHLMVHNQDRDFELTAMAMRDPKSQVVLEGFVLGSGTVASMECNILFLNFFC